jgi:Na+/melibiose symporter-like transporter
MAQLGFVICFSSFSDVADYTTARYKIRANAFIVAISYFFWKFGTSITTGVFNWGLGAIGYNAQHMDVWHGSGGLNPATLAAAVGNEATKNAWGFLNMDMNSFNSLIKEIQANSSAIIAACESSLSWIRLCMQVLPALLSIVGIVSFFFYRISQDTHKEALKGISE